MKFPALTPEKLAAAARKLCATRGVNPDEMAYDPAAFASMGQAGAAKFPRWQLDAERIKEHHAILSVLMEVLE